LKVHKVIVEKKKNQ